jgi:flavin-dependent dehydrogenase
MPASKPHFDVVVIGARCAGASTAMLLARAGLSVLAVDRQEYGSDRLSTHALMRTGILQLDKWGVLADLLATGVPLVKNTSFIYGGESFDVEIKPEGGVEGLIAPRRTVLDRTLVDAAKRAGAQICHGAMLRDLVFSRQGRAIGVRIEGDKGVEEIRCGMVIGADGRQSTVARLVGAPIYHQGAHCAGSVYAYFENIPDDGFRWYFEKGTGAGAIPTNDGAHCVFVGVPAAQFSQIFAKDLAGGFMWVAAQNSEKLAAQIAAARQTEKFRGFGGCTGFFRRSFGDGWALVGDAGYFKDPLTAHGITDALRDAELLADAVISGRRGGLARYQAKRDELSNELFEVTDAIASFDWDLEAVKLLHHRLSKSTKAEYEYMSHHGEMRRLAA